MIVRAIKENPDEVLAKFDWFNDYKDTRNWAARNNLISIVARLDAGYKKWDEERMKKYAQR